MLNIEDMLYPPFTTGDRIKRLASDLHTVANFDEVLESIHEKGLYMEEGKDFYASRAIRDLEVLLKGKSQEEITVLLHDLYESLYF